MITSVFNKAHYDVEVDGRVFKPYEEVFVNENRNLRCRKELRLGKYNNDSYKERHNLKKANIINFCYDIVNDVTDVGYKYAIEALADPIIKHLPKENNFCGYIKSPRPGLNCRFFNSTRIMQRGKSPVGPHDVFFSHGIGDKNYWIGKHINQFKYAFVPGEAWKDRMRKTGYKGEIFIVGYTKLDPLLNGEYKKTKRDKPYVVWMPTHGYNSKDKGRSSYPQCLELVKQISKQYDVGLALHPTSKLNTKQKNTPTLQELVDADVVIADAGSTVYEALILGKPVIMPDWLCKKDVLNHFKKDPENFEYKIYSEGLGYHATDMNHLNQLIDKALNKGIDGATEEFIETIYPKNSRGKAGKTSSKYLIEIASSLGLK